MVRKKRRRITKTCQYKSCDSPSEVTIYIKHKKYFLCLKHYANVLSLLEKHASIYSCASLDDLKVYTKKGRISKVVVSK